MILRLLGGGRAIGVLIREGELAAKVIERAKYHGFDPHWVSDEDELPIWIDHVVVEGKHLSSWRRTYELGAFPSVDCLLANALLSMLNVRSVHRVGIAIDVGAMIGLAMGIGGRVIAVGTHSELESLVKEALELAKCMGFSNVNFYLGFGEGVEDAIEGVKRVAPSSKLLVVPDFGKPSFVSESFSEHEASAISIYYRGELTYLNI